jgi:hypothetical protein
MECYWGICKDYNLLKRLKRAGLTVSRQAVPTKPINNGLEGTDGKMKYDTVKVEHLDMLSLGGTS